MKVPPTSLVGFCYELLRRLEVSAALRVATITIELDRFAGAFARRTAILAPGLRRAGTGRILTLAFAVFVGHLGPPVVFPG